MKRAGLVLCWSLVFTLVCASQAFPQNSDFELPGGKLPPYVRALRADVQALYKSVKCIESESTARQVADLRARVDEAIAYVKQMLSVGKLDPDIRPSWENDLRNLNGDAALLKRLRPCRDLPPPGTKEPTIYVEGEGVIRTMRVASTETQSTSGMMTNQFDDSGSMLGFGFGAGMNFPIGGRLVGGPYAELQRLTQDVNHMFPNGSYLGATSRWAAKVAFRTGVPVGRSLVFGTIGFSSLHHDLNLNLGGGKLTSPESSPGWTLGGGAEIFIGAPRVRALVEYDVSGWRDSTLNQPSYKYRFGNRERAIMLGFTMHLR